MFSFAISFRREMMAAFSSRGGGLLVEQHAIHAEADAELLLERLDVNVAGALLHGVGDHGVHQADDRRLAGHVAQVFQVGVAPAVVAFATPSASRSVSP